MNAENVNVWLVGAGPGNAGLLTLRGHEVLKNAEVVIYDRLAGDGVLALIPENALKIDAGKIAGEHKLTQDEIIRQIIFHAQNNKRVVRLKGGDPFLFGRGAEEAEALLTNNIPFEIVPGVSSAVAVPEIAGIPATHRDFNSGVSIFTAHDKNNLVPDFNNQNAIFLMGASRVKDVAKKLLTEKNFSPSTPCAIIQNGTTANQKILRADLKTLYNEDFKAEIQSPAIIFVGKTANLNLTCKQILSGKRIFITRPQGRAEKLSKLLRDNGAEVIECPTIKTEVIHGALNNFDLGGYDYIAFTSVTGVRAFFELLRESERDIREIGNAKIAAIGSATEDELKNFGLKVDLVPEIYDGKHLAEELTGLVLLVRALDVSDDMKKILDGRGISFNTVHVYKTSYVKFLTPGFFDIIIFTSASTVRGFAENTNEFRNSTAVCIGEQTAIEARNAGFYDIKIAKRADINSIFETVLSVVD